MDDDYMADDLQDRMQHGEVLAWLNGAKEAVSTTPASDGDRLNP